MKIIYLANVRMPTEKAYGLAIAKMVEAFSQAKGFDSIDLALVLPKRRNWLGQSVFDYYQLSQTFKIRYLPCLDLIRFDKYLGRIPIWLEMLSFGFFVFFYLLFKKADVFYTRNKELLFLSFLKKNFYFELHRPLKKRWLFFLEKTKGVIVISNGLRELLESQGVGREKIFTARSAVDLDKFALKQSQLECRQQLGLAQDKKIVLYSGHLMAENGPQILAQNVQELPEDIELHFIGGTQEAVNQFQVEYGLNRQIKIHGHQNPAKVPWWLKAADILVMPYLATDQYAALYMSSLKMFEYMAARKTIIASNLPSIAEVLNKNNAFLVEPGNPQVLAQAIKKLLAEPDLAKSLAEQAFRDVQQFTWQKRAARIIDFCLAKK